MLDIAYLVEANIAVAEDIRERSWRELVDVEKGKIFTPAFFRLMDAVYAFDYWSIMFCTHGV